jgi:hypothetical protein
MDSLPQSLSLRGGKAASPSSVLRAHRKKDLLGAKASARPARTVAFEFEERCVRAGEETGSATAVCEMESFGQSESVDDNTERISSGSRKSRTFARATAGYSRAADHSWPRKRGADTTGSEGRTAFRNETKRTYNFLQLSLKNFRAAGRCACKRTHFFQARSCRPFHRKRTIQ